MLLTSRLPRTPSLCRHSPLKTSLRVFWTKHRQSAPSSLQPPSDHNDSRSSESPFQHIKPYLQLARYQNQIGSRLLYLPCTWSILLAASHGNSELLDTGKMLFLFGVGSLVMRGAGCTINDIWDRNIDKHVSRTKSRPLASGRLNVKSALKFLSLELSAGLLVLLQLNTYSILLGASSMALVSLYPLAKRFTNYPQLILGLTFNWGALLGWPALLGTQSWSHVLPLYVGSCLWTVVYDTLYAYQDIEDDKKVKIRSTALTFGYDSKPILKTLNVLTTISFLSLPFVSEASFVTMPAFVLFGFKMDSIIRRTNLHSPIEARMAFHESEKAGWIITLALGSQYLISYLY